nr:hypothetical protein [Vibrio nigripulchritudo]
MLSIIFVNVQAGQRDETSGSRSMKVVVAYSIKRWFLDSFEYLFVGLPT